MIPFGFVTTSFLMMGFEKAQAKSIWEVLKERGDVTTGPYSDDKYNDHELKRFSESVDQISKTFTDIQTNYNNFTDWMANFPTHVTTLSVDLLAGIYHMISTIVLQTPLWLFNNTWFTDTSKTFASVSVSLVIVLTIIESIKQIVKVKHVEFKKILQRLPFAVLGAGLAPIAFEQAFKLLNMLSTAITKIGYNEIRSEEILTIAEKSTLNTWALLGFDVVLVGLCIPIILHNGKRWFDLICLGVMTPLALSAWCFDNYRHFYNKWWTSIKALSLVQLAYAIFLTIMGLFIFGTRNIMEPDALLIKVMIVIGGLWRMANPPSIVTQYADKGSNSIDVLKGFKDAVTGKAIKKSAGKVLGLVGTKKSS